MSTINANMLKFVQIVDPTKNDGTKFTASTSGSAIGSVDGARFTKERQLAIYNDARMALFNALETTKTIDELTELAFGALVINETITFATSGSDTAASKPTGFIKYISLLTTTGNYPAYLVPTSLIRDITANNGTYYSASATCPFVFESSSSFICPSGLGFANASAGKLTYFKLNTLSLSDVTGGTTSEVFAPELEPMLMEIACAIANEQGNAEVLSLAKNLLGGK